MVRKITPFQFFPEMSFDFVRDHPRSMICIVTGFLITTTKRRQQEEWKNERGKKDKTWIQNEWEEGPISLLSLF